jgi:hypothetical protein
VAALVSVLAFGGAVVVGVDSGHTAQNVRLLSGSAWLSSARVGQVTLLDGTSAEVSAQVHVTPAGNALSVVQLVSPGPQTIQVYASASPGFKLVRWEGNCGHSSATDCGLGAGDDDGVTAHFETSGTPNGLVGDQEVRPSAHPVDPDQPGDYSFLWLLALILANLLLGGWVLRNRRRSGAMS